MHLVGLACSRPVWQSVCVFRLFSYDVAVVVGAGGLACGRKIGPTRKRLRGAWCTCSVKGRFGRALCGGRRPAQFAAAFAEEREAGEGVASRVIDGTGGRRGRAVLAR